MNYSNGGRVQIGDRVELWRNQFGIVVCCIDGGEYSQEFPEHEWSYLKAGVLIRMDNGEIMHSLSGDFDLKKLQD